MRRHILSFRELTLHFSEPGFVGVPRNLLLIGSSTIHETGRHSETGSTGHC